MTLLLSHELAYHLEELLKLNTSGCSEDIECEKKVFKL